MVPETITLKEVLDWIDAGNPIDSMAFVTHDEKRNTGGEWIEVKDVFKHDFVSREERVKMEKAQPQVRIFKNPNHYENSTRNIALHKGREIRKVHIRLIRRFNGKIVT